MLPTEEIYAKTVYGSDDYSDLRKLCVNISLLNNIFPRSTDLVNTVQWVTVVLLKNISKKIMTNEIEMITI